MSRHVSNPTLIAINRALLSGTFRTLGALPWPIVRGLASGLAWIAHRMVRYRIKICTENIATSFPEMTPDEVDATARGFYLFLADYFFETLKMGTMKADEMKDRMKFENIEQLNDDLRAGHNVSIFLGHYCNWEWVSTMPLWLDLTTGALPCQIYHPLSNAAADQVFGKLRTRFGATNLPMSTSAKTLMEMNAGGRLSVTGYIADQTPKRNAIHHWLQFLNHDTGVFTGAEKISRKIHAAAYYLDMTRTERGRYVGKFVKISDDVAAEAPNAVTERYFEMLEASIRRQPSLWLWTHRRWRAKR